MYSFDHDLEEFVAIGLGTVSADGSVIESNPGVGVVKAGWHCGSQPAGGGDVGGACVPEGSIINHVLDTVPAAIGGNITLSRGKTVEFSTSAEIKGKTPESCSPNINYSWDFHDYKLPRRGATTTHTFNRPGTHKITAIVKGSCKCPVESLQTITVTVSELEVKSSSDPVSNAVGSFVVAPSTTVATTGGRNLGWDPIIVKYPGTLGPGESIVWKVEAMQSNDSKAPLFRGYGGVEVLPLALGGTGVTGSGSGYFGAPWKSDLSNIVTTVKFLPKPPLHLPASYTGGLQNASVAGTKGIDKYQRNPQLAYKISATILPTVKPLVSIIVRMDEKDMIRQEYITHLASAPASANDVKVPTRAQIVSWASLGGIEWGSNGVGYPYPYQYVVNDGMQHMWTFYKSEFEGIPKVVPLSDPYAGIRDPNGPNPPPFPGSITLEANQTARVTSAYRNPERNEFFSTASASRHMLGRALDVSVNNIGGYGTQSRGAAFYKAWETIHRLTPLPAGGYNPIRITGTPGTPGTPGTSTSVPWADRWALETGNAKDILVNNSGWVTQVYNKVTKQYDDTFYAEDINQDGVLDGYEATGHLHIQDNPNQGGHL